MYLWMIVRIVISATPCAQTGFTLHYLAQTPSAWVEQN